MAATFAGVGAPAVGSAPIVMNGSVATVGAGGTEAAGASARRALCSNPHTPSSFPSELAYLGDTLYFAANDGRRGDELWKTNGTAGGTQLVKDIRPGGGYSYYGSIQDMTTAGGLLFFTVDDGSHGRELWKTDGTAGGTQLVKDIRPGKRYNYHGSIDDLTGSGSRVFFTVDDMTHGQELWVSDGTDTGTTMVKDIRPRDYWSEPTSLTDVGGTLYFAAEDGTHGKELWRTDGTAAGTTMVKDINPDAAANPGAMVKVGDKLFFVAQDGVHAREVWVSNGTDAGTAMVKDIGDKTKPVMLTDVGGTLYFAANDGATGRELWTSDGTDAGTVLVKDIHPGKYTSKPNRLTDVGGTLFFTALDGTHGQELWTSDGADTGTTLVKDIAPGSGGYGPQDLTAVGGTLYFSADDSVHGAELWKTTDGTDTGTAMVKDIDPRKNSYFAHGVQSLTDVNGKLYFTADDRVHGVELWTTDGTDAGTEMVSDINKGGRFAVAKNGTRDTSAGTMQVKVNPDATGRVVVGPAGKSPLKTSSASSVRGEKVTLTLKPTKAGIKKLKQNGKLTVKARFTFKPCGVSGQSIVRKYTLRMRRG